MSNTVLFYEEYLNDFIDDASLELEEKIINRLAVRAVQLEKETDFSLDDIREEIIILIPAALRENEDILDFVDHFSDFILTSAEEGDGDDEDFSSEDY